jgi:SRSO17 transposase
VTQLDLGVAAAAMVEAEQAGEKLDALMAALGPHFARVEPFRQARKYITALIGDLPRKNCWTIAEYAGDATPDRMQRLLERASWDTFAAMNAIRDFVVRNLACDGLTVVVLDESGDEKQGTHTAGVKPQYVGCAGQVTNAINFVNCTYVTPAGHALIGSRLYIPAEQAADAEHKTARGIPADLEFKTKPALAIDLLAEQIKAGIEVPWCTADAVYGQDPALRAFCEQGGIGYVLGIPCSFRLTLGSGRRLRADAVLKVIAKGMWQIASCGPGSKGERRWAWAWLATAEPGHFLLIRRNLAKPTDLAFFYCYVPEGRPATLGGLIAVVGRRWTVEEDHEFGKDHFGEDHEFGKDHFGFDQAQVRRFTPICRHLVLVMAALAVCAVTAAHARGRTGRLPPGPAGPDQDPPEDPGLIALTVPEVKRLFNLLTRTWRSTAHHLHWSEWRRRHQARARWFHQRERLQRYAAAA